MYKRMKPENLQDLRPANFKIDRVFMHYNSKAMRPINLVHQRWLFILIVGYKSFAFDFITHRHIEFPKLPLLNKINFSVDAKVMVLNDRDLVVVNSARHKKDGDSEILVMDMHQLTTWKRLKIREDMRSNALINFAILPFVKED